MSRNPVRAGLAVVAVSLPVLAGCSAINQPEIMHYAASDGIESSVGALQVRNLVVISDAVNQPGVVSGTLVNTSNAAMKISIGLSADQSAGPDQITLGAGQEVELARASSANVTFPKMPVAPGSTVDVTMATPAAGSANLQVPVLASNRYYSTVTPTAS